MKKAILIIYALCSIQIISFSVMADTDDAYISVQSGSYWYQVYTGDITPTNCGRTCWRWDVDHDYCDDVDGVKGLILHDPAWSSCDWYYSTNDGGAWYTAFDSESCDTYDPFNDVYRSEATETGAFDNHNLCNYDVMKITYYDGSPHTWIYQF